MRHVLASCLLLAIALPCQAQGEKPKPNTLTPKEIADGWILLFDGENTFGWNFPEKIAVADGALHLENKGRGHTIRSSSTFSEFELSLEYRGQPLLSLQDSERKKDGLGIGLKESNDWRMVAVRVDGGKMTLSTGQNAPWNMNTDIGVDALDGKVALRNIKLRPLNTKPLFNGKDLTGWKEFPSKKSKFAVVDGAINVTNGPGDLQTVGKYKDFILQLECKSNGKHLNSGIFFRCRDNEYQNGYEAQIRNEFTDKPTQKYLIEEYDPKTNKLIGKKEQHFTAVDYGTGAIYRRQPARKQMSKDGEWFAMTIVAHGNHFATWVNGVQVTDWTDNRKKSDNARTGCKLEAGHISIQGHDPTTNLSFRNFRIAEFK